MPDEDRIVMVSHGRTARVKTGDMVSIHYSGFDGRVAMDRKIYGRVTSFYMANHVSEYIVLMCFMDSAGSVSPGDSYPVNIIWRMPGVDRDIMVLTDNET